MNSLKDLQMCEGGRFLPFGYTVPAVLEECLTWQIAMQWMSDKLKWCVDEIEHGGSGDIDQLADRVRELEASMTEVNGAIVVLQNKVRSLEDADFQTQINNITGNITTINTTISGLRDDINTLTLIVNGHTTSISALTSSVDTITGDVSALSLTVTTLSNTVTSIAGNLQDLTDNFNSFKSITQGEELSIRQLIASSFTYLDNKIDNIPGADLSNYYTKQQTYSKNEIDNALTGKQNTLTFDDVPTEDSNNPVKSNGIYEALEEKVNTSTYNTGMAGKQDTLTFDQTPTENSTNPVTSGGVYEALQNIDPPSGDYVTEQELEDALATKQNLLTFDNAPTSGSNNPVKSDGIYTALQGKADTFTTDIHPTLNSTNPVQSGGVYDDLQLINHNISLKQDALTFDNVPTPNSNNPVKSGGVYTAIPQLKSVFAETDKESTTLAVTPSYVEDVREQIEQEIPPSVIIDNAPTSGSNHAVSSGGTYSAIQQVMNAIPDVSGLATKSELNSGLAGKQDTLTFDNAPTSGSSNPVKSGGVFAALETKADTFTTDIHPTLNSTNPVQSGGVYDELQLINHNISLKQDALTFDNTPTSGSDNPVKSGGVYTALQGKANAFTTDVAPTQNSTNPVMSGGVYASLQGKQNTLTFDSTPTANSQNPVTSDGIKAYVDAHSGGGGSITQAEYLSLSNNSIAYTEKGITGTFAKSGSSGSGLIYMYLTESDATNGTNSIGAFACKSSTVAFYHIPGGLWIKLVGAKTDTSNNYSTIRFK